MGLKKLLKELQQLTNEMIQLQEELDEIRSRKEDEAEDDLISTNVERG